MLCQITTFTLERMLRAIMKFIKKDVATCLSLKIGNR